MKKGRNLIFPLTLTLTLIIMFPVLTSFSWKSPGTAFARAKTSIDGPVINDTHSGAQLVVGGLKAPSAMAFLGPEDILVTEKNTGNVIRIVKGVVSQQPLLHLNVTKRDERGLVGLAISEPVDIKKHIFLYYTEAELNESGKVGADLPILLPLPQ